MSISNWAENEVKLACKKENPEWDGKSFDYGCSCYQSALKAYNSVCEDDHSGCSFGFTRNILIRLLNELPLTPIEDTEDSWSEGAAFERSDNSIGYQCIRMFSLFKYVYKGGTVKYSDNHRAVAIDIDTNTHYSGWVLKIIDELFPITMPYYPKVNKYKLYTKEFIAQGYARDNEDYNTRAILYCITPEGEKVEINKYYADTETQYMVEITEEEYKQREQRRK